jgi:hypothetical protein
MNDTIDATEPEPIILAVSNGRRHTLKADLTYGCGKKWSDGITAARRN